MQWTCNAAARSKELRWRLPCFSTARAPYGNDFMLVPLNQSILLSCSIKHSVPTSFRSKIFPSARSRWRQLIQKQAPPRRTRCCSRTSVTLHLFQKPETIGHYSHRTTKLLGLTPKCGLHAKEFAVTAIRFSL
jgi:hypothetical protein